ncbi:hypothetical protein GF318_02435 [Candidatus Micrarchaeota archaeon]|nr:hypothetical protein [Candidatus Micrarchaeota archaeon]
MKGKMLVFLFAALMTAAMANDVDPYLGDRWALAACFYDTAVPELLYGLDDFEAPEEDYEVLSDAMEDALDDMQEATWGEDAPDYGAFNTAYAEFMSAFNQMQGMWFYYGTPYYLGEGGFSALWEDYGMIQRDNLNICLNRDGEGPS